MPLVRLLATTVLGDRGVLVLSAHPTTRGAPVLGDEPFTIGLRGVIPVAVALVIAPLPSACVTICSERDVVNPAVDDDGGKVMHVAIDDGGSDGVAEHCEVSDGDECAADDDDN